MPALSVLVIDDDDGIRKLCLLLFVRNGYRVECASNGREGLDRLRADDYDAVILDLMMREVSGFDLLDVIEKENPKLLRHIVVATGASRRDLEKLEGGRVFAVIRKPFDIHELVQTVRECSG
jgi:two-component system response regulator AtoC